MLFLRDEAAAVQRHGLTPAGSSSAFPGTPRRGQAMVPGWTPEAVRREYAMQAMDPRAFRSASMPQVCTGEGVCWALYTDRVCFCAQFHTISHQGVAAANVPMTSPLELQHLLDRLQANHTHMQHMAAAAHNMSPHTHAQAVGEYRERVGGTLGDASPRQPIANPFAAQFMGAQELAAGPWTIGAAPPTEATPFLSSMQVVFWMA